MSTLRKTIIEMENDSYNRSIGQPMQIQQLNENMYSIFNEISGFEYVVEIDEFTNEPISCTCPHYQYRLQDLGLNCKHMYALINHLNYL